MTQEELNANLDFFFDPLFDLEEEEGFAEFLRLLRTDPKREDKLSAYFAVKVAERDADKALTFGAAFVDWTRAWGLI